MSKETPSAVLEWGPSQSVMLNLGSGAKRSAADIGEASQVLNGRRDVVAAVSRRAAFVRAIRVPNVGKEEVAQILRMQLAGLFPVPEAELAYDFRLTNDIDIDGRLAVVGAMRESDLLRLHAEAKANGIRIRKVLPAAFGSMVVARNLGLPTCAVVQQTAEGIAIDIIADGELRYTRVTPSSTDAAMIEAEIQRTFAAAGVPSGPTVATEGIHLPGAVDARTTTLEALGSPGAESLHLNLEPSDVVLAREKRKQGNRSRLAGLFWIATILLAAPVYLDWSDKQTAVTATNAKNAKILKQARDLRDGEIRKAGDVTKLNSTLQQAFIPGQTLGDALTAATNDAPPGLWLTGVTLERGKYLSLRGTSLVNTTITTYLHKLADDQDASGQKRFRDVKLVFASNAQIETKNVVTFSISAFPIGNVPVTEQTKGTKK